MKAKISPFQHGFLPGKLTTQFLSFYENLASNLNYKLQSTNGYSILRFFQLAFDSVSLDALMASEKTIIAFKLDGKIL